MKKILAMILALVMVLSLAACAKTEPTTGTADGKEPAAGKDGFTIGIIQLAPHVALDAATEGFQDAVKEAFGDKVTFDLVNAAGDSNTCVTAANTFVTKGYDLIMANATAALQAAYNATETIPVLGTSITEYGTALELKDFNGTVGGNVSGTSDLAPLTEQGDLILELFPEAKNVGIIYCSAEPNSEYQVKVMEEYLSGKGLTVTRYSFSDSNDITAVTTAAADASDVIYIPTDNAAATAATIIGNILKEKKVPCVAGEEGICAGCGVATLSISYYDLGYKTGEMAVKILKGEADISTMPIDYAPAVKKYNKEFAELFGITIPSDYEAIKTEANETETNETETNETEAN